jgi:hypothetical protein
VTPLEAGITCTPTLNSRRERHGSDGSRLRSRHGAEATAWHPGNARVPIGQRTPLVNRASKNHGFGWARRLGELLRMADGPSSVRKQPTADRGELKF